jgi:hypothetical protein
MTSQLPGGRLLVLPLSEVWCIMELGSLIASTATISCLDWRVSKGGAGPCGNQFPFPDVYVVEQFPS